MKYLLPRVPVGKLFISLATASLFFTSGYGDVIAQYAFNNGSTASTATPIANVTAGAFAGSGGATFSSSTDMGFIRSSATTDTLTDAISGGHYWEFSIEVDDGYSLDLSSLVFDHYASSNTASGYPFDSHLSVFTSVDGFAAAGDALVTSTGTIGSNPSNSGTPILLEDDVTITLSDTRFQGLEGTTFFRIYAYDNVDANDQINRLDNVFLNGSISAIPEPSRFALLAGVLGFACGAMRRR